MTMHRHKQKHVMCIGFFDQSNEKLNVFFFIFLGFVFLFSKYISVL